LSSAKRIATCSASLSSIGLSGLASGACAASPANACCSVYCARTGMALKRDWNVGTSMRCSESLRDLPSCANNPSIERTSSSSTLNPPPAVPAPTPGTPATAPAPPACNIADAVRHFPSVGPSAPGAPTPPLAPVPPPPPPPTPLPSPTPPPPPPPPLPPVPVPPPAPVPPPTPPPPVPPDSHKPEPPAAPPPGAPLPPLPVPPPDPPPLPRPNPGPGVPEPCPGPPIPPPPPPLARILSAARIICSILFGSSKKSLNLSPAAPSTFCVSCAATLMPATEASSAT